MPKITRYFTWEEFDKSIEYIAGKCKNWQISSIYGIPRGGLCMAVALSHKLNIKLTNKPFKQSLIVDDIFETGLTLNAFKDIEGANYFVLFSKVEPLWWNTVLLSNKREWIVFPWEDKNNALIDQKNYSKRRVFD